MAEKLGFLKSIEALTFDVFGTVLDLGASLQPPLAKFLEDKGATIPADQFWEQWRGRQRLEQFEDTLRMVGHSGYLETARRAFVYTLRVNRIDATDGEVGEFMGAWQSLSPFDDVADALGRLSQKYRLVVLSNGEPEFLQHLAENRIKREFDQIISVSTFGVFKPHPAVYRGAAGVLSLDVWQCMMVSANAFDVTGARACGMRAAYVNRYELPTEVSPYQPDITVAGFSELADVLTGQQ